MSQRQDRIQSPGCLHALTFPAGPIPSDSSVSRQPFGFCALRLRPICGQSLTVSLPTLVWGLGSSVASARCCVSTPAAGWAPSGLGAGSSPPLSHAPFRTGPPAAAPAATAGRTGRREPPRGGGELPAGVKASTSGPRGQCSGTTVREGGGHRAALRVPPAESWEPRSPAGLLRREWCFQPR